MAIRKRYVYRFADIAEANQHITDVPEQYPVGSLGVMLDTFKLYVSFGGLWVLVGAQT